MTPRNNTCRIAPLVTFVHIAATAIGAPQITDPPAQISVGAYSDLWEPTSGVNVRVTRANGESHDLTTDGDGRTANLAANLGEPLLVTLGEATAELGIVLGQERGAMMPVYPQPSDHTYVIHETTQPLAVPFSWCASHTTTPTRIEPTPFHSRWAIFSENPSQAPCLSGFIASLLTMDTIHAFANYNDVWFGPSGDEFRTGVVLRSGAVDVPSGSVTIEIDCRGHGFDTAPVASCFVLNYGRSAGLPAPTLCATVVDWNNERAYVWIKGQLEEGDNVILLSRGSTPYPTERLEARPPVIGDGAGDDNASLQIVGDRGAAIAALAAKRDEAILAAALTMARFSPDGGITDCEPKPAAPPAGWSCTPDVKKSDPQCSPTTLLSSGCGISTTRISTDLCSKNGSEQITTEEQAGGEVAVTAEILGVSVEITGSFSATQSRAVTMNTGEGAHQCGECKARFLRRLVCQHTVLRGVYMRFRMQGEIWYDCRYWSETYKCVKTADTEGVCSRTCN